MNVRPYVKCAIATVLVWGMASAAQASIIYKVDRSIGAGSISGFFETDGTIGALGVANITNWSLTVLSPDINGGVANTSSPGLGLDLFELGGSGLSATATDLLFDFGGSSIFFTFTNSGDFWCVAGNSNGCFEANSEVIGYNDLTLQSAHSVAHRGISSIASVPEPGSLALLLLASGLGVARSRRRIRRAE